MSRSIGRAFAELRSVRRKAFIPFITAGDPDLETTVRLVPELARSGSTVVELGIPFSDPLADGPVIQRSSERALRHGYTMVDYLEAVRRIRRESAVPVVLFSYFNPILQYGLVKLARDAAAAGVDGILVTDVTPEEAGEYRDAFDGNGIDTIFLVAPTSTPARVERICDCSKGFVYVVSRAGVTGTRAALSDTVVPTVALVRRFTELPVAVGFGISRPEQVQRVWQVADGAVVGSALVDLIGREGASPDLVAQTGAFCRGLISECGGMAPLS